MQKVFSKQFMIDNRGCYTLEQLEDCSFMKVEDFVTLESILKSEIGLSDKFWFVCYKSATNEENQQIAIWVAEIVLPIFEEQFPDDKRPRQCIEAAQQFIAGNISPGDLSNKRKDTYAAAATYATAKAANAAVGCAYAAKAAADAAYAVYAAYAAYAATVKRRLRSQCRQ
jgi:hypothetical protein